MGVSAESGWKLEDALNVCSWIDWRQASGRRQLLRTQLFLSRLSLSHPSYLLSFTTENIAKTLYHTVYCPTTKKFSSLCLQTRITTLSNALWVDIMKVFLQIKSESQVGNSTILYQYFTPKSLFSPLWRRGSVSHWLVCPLVTHRLVYWLSDMGVCQELNYLTCGQGSRQTLHSEQFLLDLRGNDWNIEPVFHKLDWLWQGMWIDSITSCKASILSNRFRL